MPNVHRKHVGGVLVSHTINGVQQHLNGSTKVLIKQLEQKRPGTELKKLLSKLGLKPAANCKCNQHIHEMNYKGIKWCEQNIDTIVDWLHEEADRAKLPFIEFGARIIVKRAIVNAKRKKG